MTKTPSRVGAYLKKWMNEYQPSRGIIANCKRLKELLRLAELEYADCETDRDKQRVFGAVAHGFRLFTDAIGVGGKLTKDLSDALIAVYSGHEGREILQSKVPNAERRSPDKNFDIARALVALELFPDRYEYIDKWSRKNANKNVKQLKNLKSNMDQKRGQYHQIKSAIYTLKASTNDSDYNSLVREVAYPQTT